MRFVAAIGLVLATVASAQTPPGADKPAKVDPSTPVSIEVFAELPSVESPKLSPDGTRVVAKSAIGNRQVLVLSSLVGDLPRLSLGTPEETDINWWRWVNDEWLIVGLGAQQMLYGEEYYITRVLSVKADFKTTRRLDWDKSG